MVPVQTVNRLQVPGLLWFARLVWDYFDPNGIAHQSMQLRLKLFGCAMYEYDSATGR